MSYILINGKPSYEPDTLKFKKWCQQHNTTVAEHTFNMGMKNEITVSTVFMGKIVKHDRQRNPMFWETVVFENDSEQCEQYVSEQQARDGHNRIVAGVMKRLNGLKI